MFCQIKLLIIISVLTCCFSADMAPCVSGLARGIRPGAGGGPEAELSLLIRGGSLSSGLLSPVSGSDMLATSSPSARDPRPANKILVNYCYWAL